MIEIKRIRTPSGSHIEPPLDQTWSDLEKLEWQAAVTSADSGMRITVTPSTSKYWALNRWWPVKGEYDVQFPGGGTGPFSFHEAWAYLSGISLGAELSPSCRPKRAT
jgi:hypothetical protein